jgi:pimeloyl-ACP methyl ester carboxylesterase
MKRDIFVITILLAMACNSLAAPSETIVHLETKTGTLEGSLLEPEGETNTPVALIIAGSGPQDRDGNSPGMINDSLKLLATELLKNRIATLRYDKRGIGKSRQAGGNEIDLRFEHYISDAQDWIALLYQDGRFSEIIVVGHSEGSLLGMLASREKDVDKFISIAGPGKSADQILKEQLKSQPPEVLEMSAPIIEKLVQGETVDNVNPILYSLFRPSVQPYMISLFKYDPRKEIAKLKIPVLIIQGSTDIQVSEADARNLAQAHPKAKVKVIKGMNHIFKKSKLDRMKNIQTYNQPGLPVMSELVESMVDFIQERKKSITNKTFQ